MSSPNNNRVRLTNPNPNALYNTIQYNAFWLNSFEPYHVGQEQQTWLRNIDVSTVEFTLKLTNVTFYQKYSQMNCSRKFVLLFSPFKWSQDAQWCLKISSLPVWIATNLYTNLQLGLFETIDNQDSDVESSVASSLTNGKQSNFNEYYSTPKIENHEPNNKFIGWRLVFSYHIDKIQMKKLPQKTQSTLVHWGSQVHFSWEFKFILYYGCYNLQKSTICYHGFLCHLATDFSATAVKTSNALFLFVHK